MVVREYPAPELLAQRQLEAYNNRDIEAFLEPYADDVEVYLFPHEPLYSGKVPMRAAYAAMFARFTELHCIVTQRIVQGITVIDKERITGLDPASVVEATAIYQVKDGKIQTVHFIR